MLMELLELLVVETWTRHPYVKVSVIQFTCYAIIHEDV